MYVFNTNIYLHKLMIIFAYRDKIENVAYFVE